MAKTARSEQNKPACFLFFMLVFCACCRFADRQPPFVGHRTNSGDRREKARKRGGRDGCWGLGTARDGLAGREGAKNTGQWLWGEQVCEFPKLLNEAADPGFEPADVCISFSFCGITLPTKVVMLYPLCLPPAPAASNRSKPPNPSMQSIEITREHFSNHTPGLRHLWHIHCFTWQCLF
jgi:hypothetical protein